MTFDISKYATHYRSLTALGISIIIGQIGTIVLGFTEPTVVKDYPIRNRKVLLHVRLQAVP